MSATKASARKRKRRLNPWLIALVLVLVAGGAWAALARPWEPKATVVAIETVTPAAARRVLAVNGRVTPSQQVEISSTVNGRILQVAVNEGDPVRKGAVLLVIDDSQQRAAVLQVQSQLDAAQAQLGQAELDLKRAEALTTSVSRKARDDARLAVETAKKEVDRLTAQLDQAKSLLGEYTVRAPFDGTILSRGADPGQVVAPATELFLFADTTTLYGETSVDELYASEVQRGLRAQARPAGHVDIIQGEVIYVSPRVDASTGGRLVRVALPGAGEMNLPVGLTVMINIVVEEKSEAITIPRSALVAGDSPAVYVMVDGKAELRPVQYVDWPSDRLIVLDGLEPGDALIVDGAAVPASGAPVRPGA